MKVILIRHGLAEEKRINQTDLQDFQRQLTKRGIRQTRYIARRYRKLFREIQTLYSSPLLRAVQTAEVIQTKHPSRPFEIMVSLDKLVNASEFVSELQELDSAGIYGFVGHNPHLTEALKLILGQPDLDLELLKSGVIILEGSSVQKLKLTALISPLL